MTIDPELGRLFGAVVDCAKKDYGLFIAFTEGDGFSWPKVGFGFLVFIDGHYVLLNAVAHELDEALALRLVVVPSNSRGDNDEVSSRFLDEVAIDIGITPDELIDIVKANQLPLGDVWHFVGVVNKIKSDHQDNTSIWRVLWGRVVELAHRTQFQLRDTDPKVDLSNLKKKLLYNALNSQIVLDR